MERACFGCLLFSEALRLPRGPSETNAGCLYHFSGLRKNCVFRALIVMCWVSRVDRRNQIVSASGLQRRHEKMIGPGNFCGIAQTNCTRIDGRVWHKIEDHLIFLANLCETSFFWPVVSLSSPASSFP